MRKQRRNIKNGRSLADVLNKSSGSDKNTEKSENPNGAKSGGKARSLFQFGEKPKLKGFAQSFKDKPKEKDQDKESFRTKGNDKNTDRKNEKFKGKFKENFKEKPKGRAEQDEDVKPGGGARPSKKSSHKKSNGQRSNDRFRRGDGPVGEQNRSQFRPRSQKPEIINGVIKRSPDGFGFLVPADPKHPDVYIPRHEMEGIMTNDRVKVEASPSREAGRFHGKIIEVESRAFRKVVGRLHMGSPMTLPDMDKGWGTSLIVDNPGNMQVKDGDLVAVEITHYPSSQREFRGQLIEVLGEVEDPIHDVKRIIFGHHIPHEFSPMAQSEAKRWGDHVAPAEIQGRRDIRDLNLVTIDGATARDFDDAVFVEQTARGFRCVVAIADVSHYVLPGTQLDQEAYERGNSTYFPNFVVPMLPEELSNNLCSLMPNVPRLCFVADMQFDFQGLSLESEIYEATMLSKARVIYGEAQEIIDGNTPAKLKHVEENILRCADLAKLLMAKRFREGSLELEIPETQVVVDERGETVDVIKSSRLFAHRLIEELMLAANVCVAKFLTQAEIPAFYRVHEAPKVDNLTVLQKYLWNFGSRVSMQGDQVQKKLTKALQGFEGKPEALVLNILTLRSMQQARYSPENLGHFGLGFQDYTHFTSPIRRYPDLIVHRLLKSLIYPRCRRWRMTEDELATAGQMLSATEQRSVKAERQLVSIKKARFMQKFVGQEFEGMISSVAKFGAFVLLRAYDVDGLVKMEKLGDDRFEFDPENLRLQGKKTRKVYAVGDWVKIRVESVNVDEGRLDFSLVTDDEENAVKHVDQKEDKDEMAKHGSTLQKRSSTKNDRLNTGKVRVSKRRR